MKQFILATLVTTQNYTKMPRNVTFVLQIAYFCIIPNKRREKQNFEHFFTFLEQHLSNFLRIFVQLFGKCRMRSINQSINQSIYLTWSVRLVKKLVYRYATKEKEKKEIIRAF